MITCEYLTDDNTMRFHTNCDLIVGRYSYNTNTLNVIIYDKYKNFKEERFFECYDWRDSVDMFKIIVDEEEDKLKKS